MRSALTAFAALAPLVLAGLLLPGPAAAEIYRWTDANGDVHFSSNPADVPPAQRGAGAWTPKREVIGADTPPAAPAPRYRPSPAANSKPRSALGVPKIHDPRKPAAGPEKPLTTNQKYEMKCNDRGTSCRRVQTQEFRDWKARKKAEEALRSTGE